MSTYRNLITLCAAAVLTLGLAACGGGSDSPMTDGTEMGPTPEQQIAALQAEINALRAQLGLAADDDLSDSISDLQDEVADLKQQIQDAADDEADRMAAEARATAAKLYAGISAPSGDGTGASDRFAAYSGTNDSQISVTFGDGTTAGTAIVLSENKKAMVADNHGWAGKMYMDAAGGDMVEAVVYSDVAAPTMGKKFGGAAANDEFEYALTNGSLSIDTSQTGVPARVALTGVTRTAGTETFKLPDPNPSGATMINVPGSYHGVSGTYSCTPSTPADGCTASVAASGFTLGAGTWTFMPGDPNARVMSAPDTAYASYGWWIHKTENGMTFTASAFADRKGADPTALAIADLRGTATYMGGAAGKYALASSTGGTNDAGHFTAMATLEAEFGVDHKISGTIDNFVGADGMARDWSVELMASTVSDTGGIAGDPADSTDTGAQMTKWTLGGTAAAASGMWSGNLAEAGTDGVPKVVSGTFYSEYGTAGKMVGGFGANVQ